MKVKAHINILQSGSSLLLRHKDAPIRGALEGEGHRNLDSYYYNDKNAVWVLHGSNPLLFC